MEEYTNNDWSNFADNQSFSVNVQKDDDKKPKRQ